ncbi:hypothetical protein [Oerskovia flava]|uniref:hypothetical protein n=1 Tax=Oerskovia flava TaxID=2986422 RepID=UPI00223EDAD7|nr:hypothetical protein [Oerskovia sp. JB1-3-2]
MSSRVRPGTRVWSSRHPRLWPWWVQVLVVYGLARAASAVILVVVARAQEANLWTGAAPSYAAYTGSMWDAGWYEHIATVGYPVPLPTSPDGVVPQNPWAFYPLFPALARALMAVTGGSWDAVAPTLALVSGAGAVLVIHRLVASAQVACARRPGLPLATVAVVSTAAAAPALQVAYTESLALLLVASTLLLMRRRQYGWTAVVVLALGLTRPVALPVVAVVLWHGVGRVRGRAPRADLVRLAGLLLVALVSGVLWQVVAATATGRADAYLVTQSAWRGGAPVEPFVPWLEVSRWLFDGAGPWLLGALTVGVGLLVVNPVAVSLGREMHAWAGAYLVYVVAAIQPGTSLVRFVLLDFPLAAVVVGWTRSRWWLTAVVTAGLAGQVWWVWELWRLVPPSGWPP